MLPKKYISSFSPSDVRETVRVTQFGAPPTQPTPAAPFFPPPPTNIDTADSGFPSSSSLAPTLSTHKRMLLVRACANQGRNKFFSFLYLHRSRGAFVVRKSQRRFLQSNDKIQQSFSGFTSFVRNSHEVFAYIYI